jgi:hypothetical protein
MARPRRTTEEEFYDIFSSWPIDDQAMALRVMEQIHRIAKRTKTLNKSALADSPAPTFNSLRDRINGQPSLSELPDESDKAEDVR